MSRYLNIALVLLLAGRTLHLSAETEKAPHRASLPERELERQCWTAEDSQLDLLETRVVRLIQENPSNAFAHYLMSQVMSRRFAASPVELESLRQATDLAQQAIDLSPQAEFGYIALAQVLDQMGQTQRGVDILKGLSGHGVAAGWRTQFSIARLSADSPNVRETIASLEEVTRLDPEAVAIVGPYLVAVVQGLDSMEDIYTETYRLNQTIPHESFALALAALETQRKNFTEAHKLYSQIIAANPTNVAAAINDANVLSTHLNSPAKARQVLRSLLGQPDARIDDPSRVTILASQGTSALAEGENQAAGEYFIEAYRRSKGDVSLLDFIQKAYRAKKASADFAKLLRKIITDIEGSGILFAILGETLSEDLANHEQAVIQLRTAIFLEPNRSDFHTAMGLSYYRMKHYGEALALFSKATEIDPTDATARYNEACILSLMGKGDDAIASLREALAIDPRLKETALSDDDFAAIRPTPQFQALTRGFSDPATPEAATGSTSH